jgi:hypothetical protein
MCCRTFSAIVVVEVVSAIQANGERCDSVRKVRTSRNSIERAFVSTRDILAALLLPPQGVPRLTSTRHCVINASMGNWLRTPAKRAEGPKAISYQYQSRRRSRRSSRDWLTRGSPATASARPVLRRFEEIRTELDALYQTWAEEQARLEQASQYHI